MEWTLKNGPKCSTNGYEVDASFSASAEGMDAHKPAALDLAFPPEIRSQLKTALKHSAAQEALEEAEGRISVLKADLGALKVELAELVAEKKRVSELDVSKKQIAEVARLKDEHAAMLRRVLAAEEALNLWQIRAAERQEAVRDDVQKLFNEHCKAAGRDLAGRLNKLTEGLLSPELQAALTEIAKVSWAIQLSTEDRARRNAFESLTKFLIEEEEQSQPARKTA